MKYRKKPVVISAVKWDGKLTTVEPLLLLPCAPEAAHTREVYQELGGDELFIPTLEGTHRANVGDYILCGVKGELYPCKGDIFEATYDPVE